MKLKFVILILKRLNAKKKKSLKFIFLNFISSKILLECLIPNLQKYFLEGVIPVFVFGITFIKFGH